MLLARVCEKAIIGPEASMFVPCLTNFLLLLYYTRTSNSQTRRLLQFNPKFNASTTCNPNLKSVK